MKNITQVINNKSKLFQTSKQEYFQNSQNLLRISKCLQFRINNNNNLFRLRKNNKILRLKLFNKKVNNTQNNLNKRHSNYSNLNKSRSRNNNNNNNNHNRKQAQPNFNKNKHIPINN